ncbi:MAG: hypothetical protein K6T66_00840 [Peptococcaceae bacterium]|nr:hypothetical protein [Peptococcaceae bacterium]
MEKIPIDLSTLPEPLKSMVQNIDPQVIEKYLSMYDPATLSVMLNSMLSMFQHALSPDQHKAIKEMIENFLKTMPQNK